MRQFQSPDVKPLCPTNNVNAALASYKTALYLLNLHNLAIIFFLTKITKLAILFYLQRLPGLETNFKLRDRDRNGSRPRPVRSNHDRDHKKSVSRPTALHVVYHF